jgi:hypothetical protein
VDTITYKGYEIQAVPYRLAESGDWAMKIIILHHRGDAVTTRDFYAHNRFKTENDAIQHCFDFGKKIIDGQIPNCSINDL